MVKKQTIWFDRLGTKYKFSLPLPEYIPIAEETITAVVYQEAQPYLNSPNVTVDYNIVTNEGKVWCDLQCVGVFCLKEI